MTSVGKNVLFVDLLSFTARKMSRDVDKFSFFIVRLTIPKDPAQPCVLACDRERERDLCLITKDYTPEETPEHISVHILPEQLSAWS